MGPQSGGTRLVITGQYLSIGSKISAYLDNLPCLVNATQAYSSQLLCTTTRAPSSMVINSLTVIIDGANRSLSPAAFTYMPDPTILEIKPLKSFVSGGRMITVHGTNLNTIQKPEMIVYADGERNIINKTVSFIF